MWDGELEHYSDKRTKQDLLHHKSRPLSNPYMLRVFAARSQVAVFWCCDRNFDK